MPGLKLLTKLEPATCLKAAWRAAQNLGYSLSPLAEGADRFTASKGNVLLSILAGPLAPACNFEISVHAYASANEVVLEKNAPWITSGAIGVNRVNRQAEELMSAIASALEQDGGTVLERKEF